MFLHNAGNILNVIIDLSCFFFHLVLHFKHNFVFCHYKIIYFNLGKSRKNIFKMIFIKIDLV